VSFYWAETDAHPLGRVPQALTQAVSPHHVCMQGTANSPVHCIALDGEVGKQVSCRIYAARSSTCREFSAGSEACNRARAMHNLPAIQAEAEV